MHTIQCIIPYIQFIYPGCRCHTRSYVNDMGQFGVVVELERCECGALGALIESINFLASVAGFLIENQPERSKSAAFAPL